MNQRDALYITDQQNEISAVNKWFETDTHDSLTCQMPFPAGWSSSRGCVRKHHAGQFSSLVDS
jgi:hypothetical protein